MFGGSDPFFFPSHWEVIIEPIMMQVFFVFEVIKNAVPGLVFWFGSVFLFDICQLLGFTSALNITLEKKMLNLHWNLR